MSNLAEVKGKIEKHKVMTVFDFMKEKRDLIAKVLPASITPDRLIGVFTMILKSSPELAACSQSSLIAAVIQTVQLGLTPGNIGHCHYIPFNNKKKDGTYQREVQFIIGYKGIIELVNRCGKGVILTTEVVYQNDEFQYELGLNPTLRHIPTFGERGEVRGVYCVAKNLVAKEKVFVYLTKEDIEKVRAASKAGTTDYSPWTKWYEEMAKKTAIKRICKLLPLSVDDQKKIATDETIKHDIDPNMADIPSVASFDTIEVNANQPEPQKAEQPEPEPEPEPQEAPASTATNTAEAISDKQARRFYAIAKTAGYTDEEIKDHLQNTFNLKSSKDIPWVKYDEICKYFEKKRA